MKKGQKIIRNIFIIPVIIYALFLIALPIIYILIISFYKNDSNVLMIRSLTINNYLSIFNSVYLGIFLKSFLIAIITMILCMLISYPFAIAVSHKSKKAQSIFMTLVMVPFLTNSLIRMYGWIVLLRKNGVINQVLLSLNIIKSPLNLMYNNLGIIIGMVYTLLPFMILPLYSAISTIDYRLLEASSDLGATKWNTFKNISSSI